MPRNRRKKIRRPRLGDFAIDPHGGGRCIVRAVGRDWVCVETEQEQPIILDLCSKTDEYRTIGSQKYWRFERPPKIKVPDRPAAGAEVPPPVGEGDGGDLPLLRGG
jgi:hypothetical protein